MNSPRIQSHFLLVVAMLCGAILLRLVPHPPNFSPVAAAGLFGGAVLRSRSLAFLLPLFVMLLSDTLLHVGHLAGWKAYPGFHHTMVSVYACMALCVALGMFQLRSQRTISRVVGCSLLGSCVFFVITNFHFWLISPESTTLMQSYIQAIPFFRYTVLGDLFFCTLLFGGYALIEQRLPSRVGHSI